MISKRQHSDGLRQLSHEKMSLALTGFELVTKQAREREFFDEMNQGIMWNELLSLIAPYSPAGRTGRHRLPKR